MNYSYVFKVSYNKQLSNLNHGKLEMPEYFALSALPHKAAQGKWYDV